MAEVNVRSVVVAPNAFKGSLSAVEAAAAMSAAVSIVMPSATITPRPIADGGDGSIDALVAAGFTPVPVAVRGPTGRPVTATIAMRDGTAVVELANTCGLLLLPDHHPAPMTSSTSGLGDAVLAALDAGARSIVLCLGGSASTDGGVGLLRALGARVLDEFGLEVDPGGRWLQDIVSVDLSTLDPRVRGTHVTVATDVTSPLFGPEGAAVVFAPQKGASPAEVAALDAGLRSWARALAGSTGRDESGSPGSGAAGGTGVAAMAALNADVVSGAGYIAEAIGLGLALSGADLVLTGEGSLDEQSLLGKGAVQVALAARSAGVATVVVCGTIGLSRDQLRDLGVLAWGSLTDIAADHDDAVSRAAELLGRRTVEVLASLPR
jgi:glycerate kinase